MGGRLGKNAFWEIVAIKNVKIYRQFIGIEDPWLVERVKFKMRKERVEAGAGYRKEFDFQTREENTASDVIGQVTLTQ